MNVSIFELKTKEEAVVVIDDILQILKLRRARPDATGARVAAIGRIQDQLEEQRAALQQRLTVISYSEAVAERQEVAS